ncbi:MAG TPA: cytochrome c [Puia sp.]|nr:cytochrome c [Puia sp.]
MNRKQLLLLLTAFFLLPLVLLAQENHCTLQKSPKRMAIEAGQQIYAGQCQHCHQADGSGSSVVNLSLIESAKVEGDKGALIDLLVTGKSSSSSDPHAFDGAALTDEQIAAVLTYIRNSFGNSASMVKKDEVKKRRS